MSTIAVMMGLGGAAYAAVKLPANSVGTKQLKNGAVTTKKISASARSALKGQTGPQGIQGVQGIQGIQGNPGSPGSNAASALLVRIDSVPASSTEFGPAVGEQAGNASENVVQMFSPAVAMTARDLDVSTGNTHSGDVVTLRVNNTDTALKCTTASTGNVHGHH